MLSLSLNCNYTCKKKMMIKHLSNDIYAYFANRPLHNLNITTYNCTATKVAWGPPPDAQSPSLLFYAVVISNGSGTLVDNETVREEPRLIITTPDPCDHYEAIVTTMCGSITGAQTSPVVRGKYLSFNTKHVHLHTICTSTYYIYTCICTCEYCTCMYICILYVHLHTICTSAYYMYTFTDPPTSISHDQVHTSCQYILCLEVIMRR